MGWGKPSYDRINEAIILYSNNRPFARGIFAHSESTYVYTLGKKWNRFAGVVGIQDSSKVGTVVFEVYGDEKRLWKSGVVKVNQQMRFDIDVGGVERLKLVVTNAGDGGNSDWAIWLDLLLVR